jgi:HEAT repeat protein
MTLLVSMALLACACAPRRNMDDLATDDVQGVGRKYRYVSQYVIDNLERVLRSDPRGRVRANAVTALVSGCARVSCSDKVLPSLLRALEDRDPDVETRAADGLAGFYLHVPGVRPALARHVVSLRAAVSSRDFIVASHAISALKEMGERPPTGALLVAVGPSYREDGIEQAGATNDASVAPLLIQIAKADPEENLRTEAVPVAARLAAPAARDALLAALIDPAQPDHVVRAAIQAAVDTGAVAVAPQLREIVLADPAGRRSGAVALQALQALETKH